MAALRAPPSDGAPRPAHAHRRRPGRAAPGRQVRHPSARRDAVRDGLDDRRGRGIRPGLHAALLANTRRLLAGGLVPQLHGRAGGPSDRRPARRSGGVRVLRTVHTGSWLGRAYQGRGLGKEMRAAVLGFAFDGLGAQVAESSAFLDNAASNGVSKSLGYEENGLGSLAPQGVAAVTQKFRMTAEVWHSRPRPPARDRRPGRDPRHVRRRVGRPA